MELLVKVRLFASCIPFLFILQFCDYRPKIMFEFILFKIIY